MKRIMTTGLNRRPTTSRDKHRGLRACVRGLACVLMAMGVACPPLGYAQQYQFERMWGNLGTATNQFNTPYNVAVDAAGLVYVADSGNNRIRVFAPDGTFVRGWGSSGSGQGQFNFPRSIAVDSAGGLVFVGDQGNNRIQVFTLEGVFVRSFPSTYHCSLAFDPVRRLLFGINVSWSRAQVYVYNPDGSVVRWWWCGTTDRPGRYRPNGVAVDPVNGHVYVADGGFNLVRVYTVEGEPVRQWGAEGSGLGQFSMPPGIAVDSVEGLVYVADAGNNRIQVFTREGVFVDSWARGGLYGNTAGSGAGEFNAPQGVAVDQGSGRVYVADTNNHRIQKFKVQGAPEEFYVSTVLKPVVVDPGQTVVLPLTITGPSYPVHFSVTNLPVGVTASVSPNSCTPGPTCTVQVELTVAAGVPRGLYNFTILAENGIARDIPLFLQGTKAYQFDRLWGGPESGTGTNQFNSPYNVAVDAAGLVYVADSGNNRIRVFAPDGTFVRGWGSSGSGQGQFNFPRSIAVDSAGGLVFVGDQGNNRIQVFTLEGVFVRSFPSTYHCSLAFDPVRRLLFGINVSWSRAQVYVYNPDGSVVRWWWCGTTDRPGAYRSNGVAVDPVNGHVYVADGGFNLVRVYTVEGEPVRQWGAEGSGLGQFSMPPGIAVDSVEGLVYVADAGNNRIQVFTREGVFVDSWARGGLYGNTAGSGAGEFNAPQGVAVDQGSGRVYVADTNNHRIQKFTDPLAATFWLTASDRILEVNAGGTVSATLTAVRDGGRLIPVAFSVSALPQGMSAAFSQSSCTPNPACSAQLELTTSDEQAPGPYGVRVRATSEGISREIWLGVRVKRDIQVRIFGMGEISPGQTLDYVVEYENRGNSALTDAVVVVGLPGFAEFLSSSSGGVYWSERHELFWKLGEVVSGGQGRLSFKVRYSGGLPRGLDQDTVAWLGARNLVPSAFDIDTYLNYEPIKVVVDRKLSASEVSEHRADNAAFDGLVRHAQEAGYRDLGVARQVVLSDGATITVVGMLGPGTATIRQPSVLNFSSSGGVSTGGGAVGVVATRRFLSITKVDRPLPAGFADSVVDGFISSGHGSVNPGRPNHKGADLQHVNGDTAQGVEVRAIADGEVVKVGFQDKYWAYEGGNIPVQKDGYGHYVVLYHESHQLYSLYAHLRPGSITVAEGQRVSKGIKLAIMGNSGLWLKDGGSSRTHLHIETRPYAGGPVSYGNFQGSRDANPQNYTNRTETRAVEQGDDQKITLAQTREDSFTIDVRNGTVTLGGTEASMPDPVKVEMVNFWMDYAHCMVNCTFQNAVLGQLARRYQIVEQALTALTCTKAFFGDDFSGVSCLETLLRLAFNVAETKFVWLSVVVDAVTCLADCAEDPESYICRSDKRECARSTFMPGVVGMNVGPERLVSISKCIPLTGLYSPIPSYEVCERDSFCRDGECRPKCPPGSASGCDTRAARVWPASDPNDKYGPFGDVVPGQRMNYEVECENEGEGIAYGVFIVDRLDENLDETSLVLEDNGEYIPASRMIVWDIGELASKEGAKVRFSVNVRAGTATGTEIINIATIYFPSVPQELATSPIVNTVRSIVAHPQEFVHTEEDVPVAITLTGREVGGLPLSFHIVDPPMNGELSGTPPHVVYTPAPNFEGLDQFTFKVSNGLIDSEPAEVSIVVHTSALERIPPTVEYVVPVDGATHVGLQPVIRARFSEPMAPETVNTSTFRIDAVSGVVFYDPVTWEAILVPAAPLQPLTTYTVRISTGMRDSSGNALAQEYTWQFTTAPDVGILVDPPSLEFGTATVGQGVVVGRVFVGKTGVGLLSIGNALINGPDASQFNIRADTCSGQSLPWGGCIIEVVFSPTSPGQKVASLLVPSNDSVTPIVSIPLGGSAVPGIPSDTTPPVLSGCADIAVECDVPNGHTVTYSVTATDDTDPDPSVVLSHVSGSVFPVGTTVVTAAATDAAGNSSQCTFTVTVQDTAPPAITILGNNPQTLECASTYSDAGATAVDVCAGPVAVSASGAVDPSNVGSYTITYTANDGRGNIATATRTVTVVDTTAPVISCPANITVTAQNSSGAVVTFAAPTATDSCDPNPVVTLSHASGSVFPVGVTTVTATARDASGNTSSCSFTITVQSAESPIVLSYLPPIKPLIENVVKVNQTIPVKVDARRDGMVVPNLAPEIRLVLGNYTEANPDVEQEITQVSSSEADTTGVMRWSASDQHYIYNLSTKGLKTGQNYTVLVRLRNQAGAVVSEVRALLLMKK